ncbi:MAG: hypothetical protein ABEJ83_05630 [Candidatus Nanohaloarchaea archaeon]
MKAQVNLEFLAAAALFLLTIGILVITNTGIPQYESRQEIASLNRQAQAMTTQLLSNPGSYYNGTREKPNWEKNTATVKNLTSVGLGTGFMTVQKDKLEMLSSWDKSKLDYNQFKNVTGTDTQYRFEFYHLPTINTPQSFTKTYSPSDIIEPSGLSYQNADNIVHYGKEQLFGSTQNFLVTSHNGVYDTLYVSSNKDFRYGSTRRTLNEKINGYRIIKFQNNQNGAGSLVILQKNIKTFGPKIDQGSTVINLERFATMKNEPLKVEVWAW